MQLRFDWIRYKKLTTKCNVINTKWNLLKKLKAPPSHFLSTLLKCPLFGPRPAIELHSHSYPSSFLLKSTCHRAPESKGVLWTVFVLKAPGIIPNWFRLGLLRPHYQSHPSHIYKLLQSSFNREMIYYKVRIGINLKSPPPTS